MYINNNKLSAFDLRIGNYISYLNDIYQIINLTRQQEKGNYKLFGCFYTALIENKLNVFNLKLTDLHPIKITKEWLLNFGFKPVYDYPVYRLKDFQIEYNFLPNKWILEISCCRMDIKYIHQVQNIYFALTGIDIVCA